MIRTCERCLCQGIFQSATCHTCNNSKEEEKKNEEEVGEEKEEKEDISMLYFTVRYVPTMAYVI